MKTVVLGFDALDERYLDRFADSLPAITELRERGISCTLESTHPPWTGSAWPSMYTGTDPSHHGVFGFFRYDTYPDEGTLISRLDVRRPALWDYLSSEGVPSVVMNVPVTHPPDPITGVIIPGYLASEEERGHPEEIRDELSREIGEAYTIYSSGEVSDDLEEKFEGYLALVDQRRKAGLALLENYEWELAVLQVQKTDAVFHNFDDDERFREMYAAADRFVADVLEAVDEETNVILCSDHGIGPVTGYQIHVNEILREHGFVETTDRATRPSLSTEKASLVGDEVEDQSVDSNTDPSAFEAGLLAVGRIVSKFGIDPAAVYSVAERIGLEKTLLRHTPEFLREAAVERVDWRTSKAYCADGSRMGIRINLAGREPEGTVAPSEYERVREELIEVLTAVETPDGEPAFEFVCRREEMYDGPYAKDGPDILFLPTEMNHTISTKLYGRRFVSIDDHDHKRDGTFVGYGPGFADDIEGDRLSLTDVAPITMALLGRPVPTVMTGTVPDELLVGETIRADYGEVDHGTVTVEPTTDDEQVTERLEDLGYL